MVSSSTAHSSEPLHEGAGEGEPAARGGSRVRPLSRHMPGLDGVRGIAALAVCLVHFIGDITPVTPVERVLVRVANFGTFGVDLFFVLSGFLITGIMCDTREDPHFFRNFYVRRALRIFPLYYGILVALFIVWPLTRLPYPEPLRESQEHQAWLWTYLSNVYLTYVNSWALPYVGHFWSLAVEEHFYLFWPFVVYRLELPVLRKACIAIIGASFVCRLVLSLLRGFEDIGAYVLTPCRLDALCLGALAAVLAREHGTLVRLHSRAFKVGASLLAAGVAISAFKSFDNSQAGWLIPIRGTLFAGFFAALVVAATDETSHAGRFFSLASLRLLGKYSYGLYIYHGIVAFPIAGSVLVDPLAAALGNHLLAMLIIASVGLGVSLLIAIASYELFEKRFIVLKARFTPGS